MSDNIIIIGRHVVVRTYSAGVHFGTLVKHEGREVVLKDARRLWSWKGAFTLSEVATKGVDPSSQISVPVETMILTEAIEIIPTTEEAKSILDAIPAYEP